MMTQSTPKTAKIIEQHSVFDATGRYLGRAEYHPTMYDPSVPEVEQCTWWATLDPSVGLPSTTAGYSLADVAEKLLAMTGVGK